MPIFNKLCALLSYKLFIHPFMAFFVMKTIRLELQVFLMLFLVSLLATRREMRGRCVTIVKARVSVAS